GRIGEYTGTPEGEYGFFPAAGTNYSVGEEPTIAEHLNTLGKALHLHLIGISGYRSPEHSVEVGGFANDPHTRGEASDTPGVEGVSEGTLAQFGLIRPFPGAAEADHIQLLGSKY
ncbi:MAG TPA: D-Ala-D-Ala carboxypeptidase family metallohydrolase, partial [Solirubrobacteraceae bacterium]|nr:D-Ala-D-Ala carboxypeptidase family metallohydrolase [Solirubrobacteraceae bacterium]